MKFFLKCGETAEVCDKSQYEESTSWDRFRMKLHLLMCKYCRDYSSTNCKLTDSINSAEIKTISNKKKDILKAQITNEMRTKPNL